MTAESLFADLTRGGFRLEVRGDNIRITPASKLTCCLRQAIKENKDNGNDIYGFVYHLGQDNLSLSQQKCQQDRAFHFRTRAVDPSLGRAMLSWGGKPAHR